MGHTLPVHLRTQAGKQGKCDARNVGLSVLTLTWMMTTTLITETTYIIYQHTIGNKRDIIHDTLTKQDHIEYNACNIYQWNINDNEIEYLTVSV